MLALPVASLDHHLYHTFHEIHPLHPQRVCNTFLLPLVPSLIPLNLPLPHHSLRTTAGNRAIIMIEYLISLVGLYIGWSLISLELNHRRAKSIDIPLIRIPIDPLNLPFQILEPHMFKLLDLFFSTLPDSIGFMRRGWFNIEKADPHLRYGPIFALVTPRSVHLHVCDAEAIHDMFSRRQDFRRPSEYYSEASYDTLL